MAVPKIGERIALLASVEHVDLVAIPWHGQHALFAEVIHRPSQRSAEPARLSRYRVRSEDLFSVTKRMILLSPVVGEALTLRRFLMVLVGAFAALAVALGLVGVYGVLAHLVGQRRQEIAVTYALASALLLAVVVVASSVPAWKAACVPAIEALRAD